MINQNTIKVLAATCFIFFIFVVVKRTSTYTEQAVYTYTPGEIDETSALETKTFLHSRVKRCDEHFTAEGFAKLQQFSKSQDAEDQYLINFAFKGMCGGSYIELGALDGVYLSNTHFYNKGLGWSGVLIEPNPLSYENLSKNRPLDETFNRAVCASSSKVHWAPGNSAITGVYEFMPQSFRDQWHPNIDVKTLKELDCSPLSGIIESSTLGNQHIDFLSLDVEGAEFEVLKTIDFDKHQFGVIFYEADEHNPLKNQAMKTYLAAAGYEFSVSTLRSNFHINNNWHKIYEHAI